MNPADRWIEQYLKRVRLGEYLRHAAEFGAIFLFSFGTIVLAVKLLLPQFWPHVLWSLLAAIPTALAASWVARRNRCTREESVAMLDKSLGAGGLLMTLSERPDPYWKERLPQWEHEYREALPRYRPKRFAGYLILPLFFAVASCFVPLREASTAPVLKNTIARNATEELEELLTSLEETPVLEEEEQKQLEEEIERLAEESEKTPLTSEKWETVDALRERLQIRVQNTDTQLAKGLEAADELQRAELDGKKLSLKRKEQLEKKLEAALKKIGKGNFQNASSEKREQLLRLMKDGKLSFSKNPQQRQKQLQDLQDFLQKEQEKLSEIRKNCKACQNGACKPGQSEGGNSQNGNCRPGRGGVNRGRGDADMTWGEESTEQGIKFKESILPEGFKEQPKDDVIGLEASAPEVEPAASAPRGAARDQRRAAGGATNNRRLSPKHRRAVRKYFTSESP